MIFCGRDFLLGITNLYHNTLDTVVMTSCAILLLLLIGNWCNGTADAVWISTSALRTILPSVLIARYSIVIARHFLRLSVTSDEGK